MRQTNYLTSQNLVTNIRAFRGGRLWEFIENEMTGKRVPSPLNKQSLGLTHVVEVFSS